MLHRALKTNKGLDICWLQLFSNYCSWWIVICIYFVIHHGKNNLGLNDHFSISSWISLFYPSILFLASCFATFLYSFLWWAFSSCGFCLPHPACGEPELNTRNKLKNSSNSIHFSQLHQAYARNTKVWFFMGKIMVSKETESGPSKVKKRMYYHDFNLGFSWAGFKDAPLPQSFL